MGVTAGDSRGVEPAGCRLLLQDLGLLNQSFPATHC